MVKTGSHVIDMGAYAFSDCQALSSINFLSSCFPSLTALPTYAFYGCQSISTLSTLPSRIKSLNTYTFAYCDGLSGTQDLRNTGLTSLGNTYGCAYCSNVEKWILPSTFVLRSNTRYTFSNNTSLTAVEFTSPIKYIGLGMFLSCSALKHIDLPSTLTYIGGRAFMGCTSLSTVNIS